MHLLFGAIAFSCLLSPPQFGALMSYLLIYAFCLGIFAIKLWWSVLVCWHWAWWCHQMLLAISSYEMLCVCIFAHMEDKVVHRLLKVDLGTFLGAFRVVTIRAVLHFASGWIDIQSVPWFSITCFHGNICCEELSRQPLSELVLVWSIGLTADAPFSVSCASNAWSDDNMWDILSSSNETVYIVDEGKQYWPSPRGSNF